MADIANDFLFELQAALDIVSSVKNIDKDINKIKDKIKQLEIQAKIDPSAAQVLAKELEQLIGQKIVISNIGIDTSSAVKSAQQAGKQIGVALNKEISSTGSVTTKALRDFKELNTAKRQFVDGHNLISKDELTDVEHFYDTVRKAFSEFGQVTISKGDITDGVLDSLRVKIEQVNDEAKITRDFMLYLNKADNFGNTFKLADDDTIKSTEKMIQHLNEEKNIINATNEEANAIKEKLADQKKYYDKLGQVTKEKLAIEKQRITAGEKQLEILDEQRKRRDSRISYNDEQIAKKGLTDTSKQRDINNLIYSGKEKIDISFARELDKSLSNLSKLKNSWQEQGIYVDEFKTKVENLEESLDNISVGDINGLNNLKEQISSLTVEAKELSQIHEIQLSLDNGHGVSEYQTRIKGLINDFERYGVATDKAETETKSLQQILNGMNGLSGHELVEQANKFEQEFKAVKISINEAKSSYDKFAQPVSNEKAVSLINRINSFLTKNTAITKSAKDELERYVAELGQGVNLSRWNDISTKIKETENSMRGLNKLGASLKDQMSQAAQSFTQWLSVSSIIMLLVSKAKNAISELKEINTLLTEISKANDALTKSQLSEIGNNAFDVASKYGKTATDYLTGVQEMSRAGYENAESMAELSVSAQGAGDMTAELANQYIIATDVAFKMNGSIEALTATLDGANNITNHNAVNMTELAEGMSVVGTQAASSQMEVNEITAAIGTMVATTQKSGREMGNAFKGILMNLQQVSGDVGDGEDIIDAESLTKYEKACAELGVSLKEVKNGVVSLKEPMQILKELSEAYTKLDEADAKRANLLSAVGGKYRANALNAILENYDLYEKMLQDYADGIGSMAVEAEKTANSWEGSMNRLGNTWKDIIGNVVNSDVIITIINDLNSLLSVVNNVTNKLGLLGTIGISGLGVGITQFVKNFA